MKIKAVRSIEQAPVSPFAQRGVAFALWSFIRIGPLITHFMWKLLGILVKTDHKSWNISLPVGRTWFAWHLIEIFQGALQSHFTSCRWYDNIYWSSNDQNIHMKCSKPPAMALNFNLKSLRFGRFLIPDLLRASRPRLRAVAWISSGGVNQNVKQKWLPSLSLSLWRCGYHIHHIAERALLSRGP